jgi:hypothetical protein
MQPTAIATVAALASATLALTACNPAVKSTTVTIEVPAPLVPAERLCPIMGEPVGELDEVAYFESYPVYCKGRDSARQFASLEYSKRARYGADQVLPQKGISNLTCPITGEPLTASAAAVVYQGRTIGFASPADANQFRALKPERQERIISQWQESEAEAARGSGANA